MNTVTVNNSESKIRNVGDSCRLVTVAMVPGGMQAIVSFIMQ